MKPVSCMTVIANSANTVSLANAGSARAKPLPGYANTVGQPTQGFSGQAPARLNEHCSVPV